MTARFLNTLLGQAFGDQKFLEESRTASPKIHDQRDAATYNRHMREAMDIVLFGMGGYVK